VQILLDTVDKELPAVVFVVNKTLTFDGRSNIVNNLLNIFSWEQVRNFTWTKQIVNEDEETLVSNLSFSEQEHNTLIFNTSALVVGLKISF